LRIDAHHSSSERYTLAHLGSILARNRFEGSVLVTPNLPEDTPDFVKAIVVETAAIDPHRLDEWQRHPKFRGVASGAEANLNELERRGLTLDLPGGLSMAPRIAERFPGLRVVLDHLGGAPFDGWDRQLEEAARIPHLCCKLSGLMQLAPSPRPYVQHALRVFGPHRLMFASDWPRWLPGHSWKASLAAFTQAIGAQTIEVREQLLGGTAGRFYDL
jgi:L-fuconolactonase